MKGNNKEDEEDSSEDKVGNKLSASQVAGKKHRSKRMRTEVKIKKKKKSKRDRRSKREQPNLDVKCPIQIAAVGHACNVNDRHAKQLRRLLALMSGNKNELQVTEKKDEVLERPDSSIGLYLEVCQFLPELPFIWIGQKGKIVISCGEVRERKDSRFWIKFEFDGGFQEILDQPNLKNPILAFSEEFACDSVWGELKKWLEKSFEHPSTKGRSDPNDFLLAFTRTGVVLHCRIFKISDHAASNLLDGKFEKALLDFILKPLEVHHPVEENGSTRYRRTTIFLDEEKILFEEESLFSDSSCRGLISHIRLSDSREVLLPPPSRNDELLGFHTTCDEFFQQYHVFRKRQVPGTGPDPNPLTQAPPAPGDVTTVPAERLTKSQRKKRKRAVANPDPTPLAATVVEYAQLTIPMKVFCRGLISYVLDKLRMGSCLSNFTEKDIFMRGRRVVILGVKLQQHSEHQARNNCKAVHQIITERMDNTILDDVTATLKLLKENNPVYDLVVNSVAWMFSIKRKHMVVDLYEDFIEHLAADSQVAVMKNVTGMGEWLDKFKKNWLIYANISFNLKAKALVSDDAMSRFLEEKADKLQMYPDDPKMDLLVLNTDADQKLALFEGRTYFGNVRHLYMHLSDTARKRKKMEALSDELKDLVVSSEFAAVLQSLQVQIPSAFLGSNELMDAKRASYQRFAQYFCSVESIEFDLDDEK